MQNIKNWKLILLNKFIWIFLPFFILENSINGNSRIAIPTIDLEMSQHTSEEAQKMTFHDNQLNESTTAADDHKPEMYDCLVNKVINGKISEGWVKKGFKSWKIISSLQYVLE